MGILKTKEFADALRNLPADIKKLFQKQERFFQNNWLDPRLHTKRIKEIPGVYSFRVSRRYRVLFYFQEGKAIFFAIGHRKDIYR